MNGALPAAGLLVAALLTWPRAPGAAARLQPPAAPVDRPLPQQAGPVRRWVLAGVAGVAVVAVGGAGPGTLLLAAGVVVGVERWARRAGAAPDPGGQLRADLPVACDLLAVCLAAGTPVGGALGSVGDALGGPLGAVLAEVAARVRLGADPRRAWAGVPVDVAPLARVVARAGESGSSVVPALQALAVDRRAAQRAATAAAVQRAGVAVLAPLGACFLPAFLCLGVVPLVLGVAADVLG
ncbi:type II secretion system F family protein [Klenkia brasiliensis]|uniref:Type II secretion system (T2SS), protein F n=1 Tax=Klenkia brasiliensis TaxID=333142 RepID=A0A1G7MCL3_9ACTN|nr:type II secretion system F family protein [Klenkia brasiliensis]SDF58959.1 Type II secretion system (T2SS), protein F [Klenkia brasiliensis]